MKAIVGLAFGILPDGSPGKSNYKIARIITRLTDEDFRLIFVDREIAQALPFRKKAYSTTSGHPFGDKYRDTEDSVKQMANFLRLSNINEVLLIAHPFLHRFQARRLFKKYGFDVKVIHMNNFNNWLIPFCKESAQWWTRGPLHLLVYAVLQVLTGRKGK